VKKDGRKRVIEISYLEAESEEDEYNKVVYVFD